MKNIFIYLILLCFSWNMHAQQAKGVIKTNPLALAFGNFNAIYEKPLNAKMSVGVGANYWYKLFGIDVNSFGVDVGFRYYITNKTHQAPEGFYVGPLVGYNYISDYPSTIGLGGELGYQILWDSGFLLDLGAGPQYTIALGEGDDLSGFLPRFNISIGYAFK